jgi:hypothetical protein
MTTVSIAPARKINLSKSPLKGTATTVSGQVLATKVTKEEAHNISKFARRPLYWEGDYIPGPLY